MQSIATGLVNLMSELDIDEAKAFRIAQNNTRFKDAVRRTWSDNPGAAEFLLAHTNSIYFDLDDAPRIGPDKDRKRRVLGVYLDDPAARAELNARRETLQFFAAKEGLHVDSIRILPSQRGMKERRLFPESVAYIENLFGTAPRRTACARNGESERATLIQDQSNLLEILKRAFCRSFEDYEEAWSILEKVEGASLHETAFGKRSARSSSWYTCNLYVAQSDVDRVEAVIDAYGETVRSRARQLRLHINDMIVRPSPERIRGEHAFPRVGAPVPLVSYDLYEPPTKAERVAEEARAKIHLMSGKLPVNNA